MFDFSRTRADRFWNVEFIPHWAAMVKRKRNKVRAPEKSEMSTTRSEFLPIALLDKSVESNHGNRQMNPSKLNHALMQPISAKSAVKRDAKSVIQTQPALNRRQFLERAGAAALGTAWLDWPLRADAQSRQPAVAPSGVSGTLKKAVCIGVLPRELSLVDKFKLAKKTGFDGVEPNTINQPEEVAQYKEAAQAAGIRIHSIMNSDHWTYPLSDNDPAVVRKCMEGIRTSLRNAKALGADTVLLVPAVVTSEVRYVDAYQRSQQRIRELLPLAEELQVKIAVENVGNRFLLSPLEFARYIDEFNSPYLQGYFDIGNLGRNGFPQDWIRTIGKRLAKVHIKAMEPGSKSVKFDPKDRRSEGIDWIEVRRALSDIGYQGWISAEVRSGDENYLRELSQRLDKFNAGESPV